ncbi:MAG: NADH-quinone oxidoreductase subunit M [Pseudomonadota bacterium]
MDWPILSAVTFLPLLGALFILVIGSNDEIANRNARFVALWTTSVTFILSLLIWINFDTATSSFQFVEKYEWLGGNINYHMGVDGISMLFVILTTFLMPICILASWDSIKTRVKEYMIAFLVLETLMIGVFCALDLVLFYIFFEGGLIPMFLIIGVWGGKRRIYASYKFFLYTLLGSVLMLLALMAMYWYSGQVLECPSPAGAEGVAQAVTKCPTTDIPTLIDEVKFPIEMQFWLWFAFFASFAVKMPMWPVHTWLPDAHVEAPTAGSVILAGVLLKMGGYGFLRFSIPMFPLASEQLAILVFALSVIAIIYTSLVALAQEDVKKLIAYSSVAHMGFVTMGVFTFTEQGIQGSIFQMLSHGIVSAALFLCVGVVYDRMHTREIKAYGGLVNRMPIYAFCFMVFTMANVGLPGTSGFVGEFLTLLGAFAANTWVALLATTGVILSAAYALWLYRRVIYGELQKPSLQNIKDMNIREIGYMVPLVVLTIFLGIYPSLLLDVMSVSVDKLITDYKAALTAAEHMPTFALR